MARVIVDGVAYTVEGGEDSNVDLLFEQYVLEFTGELVVGQLYLVREVAEGDDLSNCGFVSPNVPFVATNAVPNVITSTVIYTSTINTGTGSAFIDFAEYIPINKPYQVVEEFVNSSNIILHADIEGAVAGSTTLLRIISDGTHTVALDSYIKQSSLSGPFVTAAGTVNYFKFFFDGYDCFCEIYQAATNADLFPIPTSAYITNIARTKAVIQFADSLSDAHIPSFAYLTIGRNDGGGLLNVGNVQFEIVGSKLIITNLDGAYQPGEYLINYSPDLDLETNRLRDGQGNLVPAMENLVVDNAIVINYDAPLMLSGSISNIARNKIKLLFDQDILPFVFDPYDNPLSLHLSPSPYAGIEFNGNEVTFEYTESFRFGQEVVLSEIAGGKFYNPDSIEVSNRRDGFPITNNIVDDLGYTKSTWTNLELFTASGTTLQNSGTKTDNKGGTSSINIPNASAVGFEIMVRVSDANDYKNFSVNLGAGAGGYKYSSTNDSPNAGKAFGGIFFIDPLTAIYRIINGSSPFDLGVSLQTGCWIKIVKQPLSNDLEYYFLSPTSYFSQWVQVSYVSGILTKYESELIVRVKNSGTEDGVFELHYKILE